MDVIVDPGCDGSGSLFFAALRSKFWNNRFRVIIQGTLHEQIGHCSVLGWAESNILLCVIETL
jgi:hypothetical protein